MMMWHGCCRIAAAPCCCCMLNSRPPRMLDMAFGRIADLESLRWVVPPLLQQGAAGARGGCGAAHAARPAAASGMLPGGGHPPGEPTAYYCSGRVSAACPMSACCLPASCSIPPRHASVQQHPHAPGVDLAAHHTPSHHQVTSSPPALPRTCTSPPLARCCTCGTTPAPRCASCASSPCTHSSPSLPSPAPRPPSRCGRAQGAPATSAPLPRYVCCCPGALHLVCKLLWRLLLLLMAAHLNLPSHSHSHAMHAAPAGVVQRL